MEVNPGGEAGSQFTDSVRSKMLLVVPPFIFHVKGPRIGRGKCGLHAGKCLETLCHSKDFFVVRNVTDLT